MHAYPEPASAAPQPSPAISPPRLWFGLLAAPLAWMLEEMLSYYIASLQCRTRPAGDAPVHAGTLWFWIVLLAGLAVALAGTWVAIDNWRRTRASRSDDTHAPPWRHDGHMHFIAATSVLTGIGFLAAFVFMAFNVVLAPICGF